jgi:competence protein ComEA
MKRQWIATSTVLLLLAILAASAAMAAGGKPVVNINTANTEELMLLPRIGPSVAQRIVEFRDKNGRFKATEDLLLVRGVGEKTFELIEPHIAVSGETTLTDKVRVPKQQPENP